MSNDRFSRVRSVTGQNALEPSSSGGAGSSFGGSVFMGTILPFYYFNTNVQDLNFNGQYGVCNGQTYNSVSFPGVSVVTPDLRGKFVCGRSGANYNTVQPAASLMDGAPLHTIGLSAANIPPHTHQVPYELNTQGNTVLTRQSNPGGTPNTISTSTGDGCTGTTFSIKPETFNVIYIIKL